MNAIIKGKMDVKFPARVLGSGFITITLANGEYTFGADFTALTDGPIADAATAYIAVHDQSSGIYRNVTLASLLTSGIDSDLQAIAALTGAGLLRRTGANTWTLGTTVTVAEGGTGLIAGVAGGMPFFSATGTMASSIALPLNAVLIGGGAAGPTYLSNGVNGQFLIGSTSAPPFFATMSGDATVTNTGALTMGANVVSNAKFRQSVGLSVVGRSANTTGNVADIVGVADQVLRVDGSNTAIGFGAVNLGTSAAVTGTLGSTFGGTGQSSYVVGDLLYASTTTVLSRLADAATGNSLISGGVGVAPSWGKVGLTTHITGTLAVGNGGLGITSGTSGGIPYFSGTSAISSTGVLTANSVLLGGGAGVSPSITNVGANGQLLLGSTGAAPGFNTMSGYGSITTAGVLTVNKVAGTATNNSATAGDVGEYVEAEILASSPTNFANGAATNLTSISLTAGDWDLRGVTGWGSAGGAQITTAIGWISTTSATTPPAPNKGAYALLQVPFTANSGGASPLGSMRISLASTTTVYLSAFISGVIGAGTFNSYGHISARRVR